MPELSVEQQGVLDQIDMFMIDPRPSKPWFIFHGYAGSGKSTLLAHIARTRPYSLMAAFTGKACSVLARKTGLEVVTIHKAIYQFLGKHHETGRPQFGSKHAVGAWTGQVVLIDEVGTIGQRLARDLLATGCRVIGCGDPGQLPPVADSRFFTQADAELKEVHRQAWDSAIIRQAHNVRQGGGYCADGPDFRVERFIDGETLLGADVVLCWRNATRRALNTLVRSHKGLDGRLPSMGEPVMCLVNDHENGVLNGGVYLLQEEHRPLELGGRDAGTIVVINERGEKVRLRQAWMEDVGTPLSGAVFEKGPMVHPFAFSYCSTVHRYQGSESNNIILVDEYNRNEQRREWLYTGCTRAAKSIIVQRNW